MSAEAVTVAFGRHTGSPTRKAVLLAIAETDDGTGARLSVAELATRTELGERAVRQAIQDLEAAHFLTVSGPRTRRVYTVEMGAVPAPAAGTPARGAGKAARGAGSPASPAGTEAVPARGAGIPAPAAGTNGAKSEPLPLLSKELKNIPSHDLCEAGSDSDSAFCEFWRAYPRKVAKGGARKAWRAALKRGADPERIVAAAERYRDSSSRTSEQFTAYPKTWLNEERYDDPELVSVSTTRLDGPWGETYS